MNAAIRGAVPRETLRRVVVRQALLSAGMAGPEIERIAPLWWPLMGLPRYVWTDSRPDPASYAQVILRAVAERQRWREQYEAAKAVDNDSATGEPVDP